MQQRGGVLHRETAGDVAHRREQRQAPDAILDGLERDGGEADAGTAGA